MDSEENSSLECTLYYDFKERWFRLRRWEEFLVLLCVLETVTENNSSFAYYYFLRPFCKSKPRLNFWCMTISDPSICSSSKKGRNSSNMKAAKRGLSVKNKNSSSNSFMQKKTALKVILRAKKGVVNIKS